MAAGIDPSRINQPRRAFISAIAGDRSPALRTALMLRRVARMIAAISRPEDDQNRHECPQMDDSIKSRDEADQPTSQGTITRWPLLLIGRNSLAPLYQPQRKRFEKLKHEIVTLPLQLSARGGRNGTCGSSLSLPSLFSYMTLFHEADGSATLLIAAKCPPDGVGGNQTLRRRCSCRTR